MLHYYRHFKTELSYCAKISPFTQKPIFQKQKSVVCTLGLVSGIGFKFHYLCTFVIEQKAKQREEILPSVMTSSWLFKKGEYHGKNAKNLECLGAPTMDYSRLSMGSV